MMAKAGCAARLTCASTLRPSGFGDWPLRNVMETSFIVPNFASSNALSDLPAQDEVTGAKCVVECRGTCGHQRPNYIWDYFNFRRLLSSAAIAEALQRPA
jgi:hypothetical protein